MTKESHEGLTGAIGTVFSNYAERAASQSERQFSVTAFFVTAVVALLSWLLAQDGLAARWLTSVLAIVVLILTTLVVGYLCQKCREYWLAQERAKILEKRLLYGSGVSLPQGPRADAAFELARRERGDRPRGYWITLLWSGSHGSLFFVAIVILTGVFAFVAILLHAGTRAP